MMNKLFAKTKKINELNDDDVKVMFSLFQKYYENVNYKKFSKDLQSKDRIIILKDYEENQIRGFSTLKDISVNINGKIVHGLFSGDTLIDSNYWGGTALSVEFFKNVMLTKLKFPMHEVYWFLISKGYKTYLLLANNFANYYPRFDKEIPKYEKQIINSFASSMYEEKDYDEEAMVLKLANQFDRLKNNVAPISKELSLKNPKIAYFEKMNPNWQKGDELCCIGKIDIAFAKHFVTRTFEKKIKKIRLVPSNA